jgi:hypothetical protein
MLVVRFYSTVQELDVALYHAQPKDGQQLDRVMDMALDLMTGNAQVMHI